jgi:predicted Abi (CAAX) family protease
MSKVWQVEIMYSDYESTQLLTIGLFTDKDKAQEVATKWETFHITYSKVLDEPDGWDPKSDQWFDHYGDDEFNWKESYQYQTLAMKYDKLKDFDEVIITEQELNKDIFQKQCQIDDDAFRLTEDFKRLVKQFDRDYKINSLGIN